MTMIKLSVAGAMLLGASVVASEGVQGPGYFMQWEGTLVPCDKNPIVGWKIPEMDTADADPDYDWIIVESMVSDPIQGPPFDLWPDLSCIDSETEHTIEMGFSMGVLMVWRDNNGHDPTGWGTGESLLQSMIGMNHQEDDGHSGITFRTTFNDKAPYTFEFVGSTTESYAGSWIAEFGKGYMLRGWGTAIWYDRDPSWHQYGSIEQFEVEPLIDHLGDVNMDCSFDFRDVPAFLLQLSGQDHDETRHILADMNEDGWVDMLDAGIFLDALLSQMR